MNQPPSAIDILTASARDIRRRAPEIDMTIEEIVEELRPGLESLVEAMRQVGVSAQEASAAFGRLQLATCRASLGVTYERLTFDLTGVNFSSTRSVTRGRERQALRARLEANVNDCLEATGMPAWVDGVEYEPRG